MIWRKEVRDLKREGANAEEEAELAELSPVADR